MIVKKLIQQEVETEHDVTCDSCGKSCLTEHGFFEYMDLSANWGYGSANDGQKWTAQVCEKCATTKFKFIKFNIENP